MKKDVYKPLLSNTNECSSERFFQDNSSTKKNNPEVAMVPTGYRHMSKGRVLKNMCALNFALLVYFSGFIALSNLQSTMNIEKGIGIDSQACIYAAALFSCLLLPDLMVKTIGCKISLVIAISCSLPYIASNFFPCWGTLIPSAVLVGLGAGPYTISKAFYTNEMARRYHIESILENFEVIVAKFYGFNSFFNENTQIWGSLISYYVLRPDMLPVLNDTNMRCGVNFRKDIWNDLNITNLNLHPPTDQKRNLLVSIYLCGGILSVLALTFFMDPLENDIERETTVKSKCASVQTRLGATIKQATKQHQILLILLFMFCGMQSAFYMGDFTEAFIACSWGIHHVGFVTMCFGACGALMAILTGPLVKCVSLTAVIVLTGLLNVIIYALLFVWHPSADMPFLYIVISGMWGMTDAIWWSQVPAIHGLLFPNDREAAFSNFFFWNFLGFFISFSYANYLSVTAKISIMLVVLVAGIILFMIGQIGMRYSQRTDYLRPDESQRLIS